MERIAYNEQLQIYHIYPFGFFDAYDYNVNKGKNHLMKLIEFIPHLKEMNINMVYIGPLFSSEYHGYDTIDYYHVDARLGRNEDFAKLVRAYHEQGIKVIVDTVFNHVSRSFYAFRDLLENREGSRYVDWFCNVNFNRNNVDNDGFSYDNWDGHNNLVKLNLENEEVARNLFDVTKYWMDTFDIDGLRLDAADVMDTNFMANLSSYTKAMNPEFFIMGEMVHGDYNRLLNAGNIDSVTNYECYKGLYSSLNDGNYFEIDYALKRQFGEGGIYENKLLYNFADNHDVNRVASILKEEAHIYPLYIMLYTMPGIPTLYYGSEFRGKGMRSNTSDKNIRRPFNEMIREKDSHVFEAIKKLSKIRCENNSLNIGSYKPIYVNHKQIAYQRSCKNEEIISILNSDNKVSKISFNLTGNYYDLLNDEYVSLQGEVEVYPYWGRILKTV